MEVLLADTGAALEIDDTLLPSSIFTINDKLYRCVCWKSKKRRGKLVDYAVAEHIEPLHYYTDGSV